MGDLNHIAEAILLLYHFWTFLVALLVLYILFRDASGKSRQAEPKPAAGARTDGPTTNIFAIAVFVALVLLSLAGGHFMVVQNNLLVSFLTLGGGFIVCALIYFTWIAK